MRWPPIISCFCIITTEWCLIHNMDQLTQTPTHGLDHYHHEYNWHATNHIDCIYYLILNREKREKSPLAIKFASLARVLELTLSSIDWNKDERNQYLRDQFRLSCNGFDLRCPVGSWSSWWWDHVQYCSCHASTQSSREHYPAFHQTPYHYQTLTSPPQ